MIIDPHTEEPGHSHRREHVRIVSAQVKGILMVRAVGKVDERQMHHQWLGDIQRQGVLDAELWTAEQLLRRLVTSGLVDRELYETTWDLVRADRQLRERFKNHGLWGRS